MIFKGRNQVPFGYSRWGYTRGNGKTWHGGIDIVGLDDTTVRMPSYNGKTISGKVITSRKVDKSTGNKTWEWGWYVCVQLDANQTPDAVNYLYFCHNEKNLVTVGQKVKTGDALAIMGNTGNAADANPPIKHVHLEVRAKSTSSGLNPTAYAGFANAVGIYGEAINTVKPFSANPTVVKIYADVALSSGDKDLIKKYCKNELKLADNIVIEKDGAMYIGPVSAGDQINLQNKAKDIGLKCSAGDAVPMKIEITTDSLRVRTGPGVDEYKQVDSVKKGEVFTVLQSYDGWYFIDNDKDGVSGWVSGEYAKVV